MQRRPLGRTGIDVSLLGLGTVKLGRDRQVKYPRPFRLPDDTEARALLNRARSLGINLLDTAPAYGSSEVRLGQLLAGQRHDWVICTKVGEEFDGERSQYDFTPEHVAFSVARSLERLATDYLDVVLIHSNGEDAAILERYGTLQALIDLRGRGLVRAVGLSHKSADGARLALAATLNLSQRDEADVIAEAGVQNCGVLIKKALASGHAGVDSLRYVAAQPGVSSIVVGTVDLDHLTANARAVA
jgi:aryl-alcohol dehydrogenase-like predicted oxidoreductase